MPLSAMPLSAMTVLVTDDVAFWWLTIGLGLVVVIVVAVLLTLLLRLVHDIERNSAALLASVEEVAGNTAVEPLDEATEATRRMRDESGG